MSEVSCFVKTNLNPNAYSNPIPNSNTNCKVLTQALTQEKNERDHWMYPSDLSFGWLTVLLKVPLAGKRNTE